MICGYVSEDWHQSQSLSNRAMSFDWSCADYFEMALLSQSLSNRAMSFDDWGRARYSCSYYVSIPFEQGDVFRPKLLREYPKYVKSQSLSNRAMSFDRNSKIIRLFFVSIPFEQGDVFRLMLRMKHMGASSSQSLSNRAMSFDSKLD